MIFLINFATVVGFVAACAAFAGAMMGSCIWVMKKLFERSETLALVAALAVGVAYLSLAMAAVMTWGSGW